MSCSFTNRDGPKAVYGWLLVPQTGRPRMGAWSSADGPNRCLTETKTARGWHLQCKLRCRSWQRLLSCLLQVCWHSRCCAMTGADGPGLCRKPLRFRSGSSSITSSASLSWRRGQIRLFPGGTSGNCGGDGNRSASACRIRAQLMRCLAGSVRYVCGYGNVRGLFLSSPWFRRSTVQCLTSVSLRACMKGFQVASHLASCLRENLGMWASVCSCRLLIRHPKSEPSVLMDLMTRVTEGRLRMARGRLRMARGRLRMAQGRLRMAQGRLRMAEVSHTCHLRMIYG